MEKFSLLKKYSALISILMILMLACNLSAFTRRTESTQEPAPPSPLPHDTAPTAFVSPTKTPILERYFQDDFVTLSSYWQFLQTGGSTVFETAPGNNSLRIYLPNPDTWYIGIHTAHQYSDVFVRAKFISSSSGSVGLICRYEESTGWLEYNIDTNGKYSVLQGEWLAAGIVKYTPITSGESNHLSTGSFDTEVGLYCEGDFLSLYANETIIRRVYVSSYGPPEGAAGMTFSSHGDVPLDVLVDWFQISHE